MVGKVAGYILDAASGRFVWTWPDWPAITISAFGWPLRPDGYGYYEWKDVPEGTHTLTVIPPSNYQGASATVTVLTDQITRQDFYLYSPTPLPPPAGWDHRMEVRYSGSGTEILAALTSIPADNNYTTRGGVMGLAGGIIHDFNDGMDFGRTYPRTLWQALIMLGLDTFVSAILLDGTTIPKPAPTTPNPIIQMIQKPQSAEFGQSITIVATAINQGATGVIWAELLNGDNQQLVGTRMTAPLGAGETGVFSPWTLTMPEKNWNLRVQVGYG